MSSSQIGHDETVPLREPRELMNLLRLLKGARVTQSQLHPGKAHLCYLKATSLPNLQALLAFPSAVYCFQVKLGSHLSQSEEPPSWRECFSLERVVYISLTSRMRGILFLKICFTSMSVCMSGHTGVKAEGLIRSLGSGVAGICRRMGLLLNRLSSPSKQFPFRKFNEPITPPPLFHNPT